MTTIENQVCVCKTSDAERGIRPSIKAHDLTLTENQPKPTNLENYKKCCCTNGKCKMSQLIRLCQEDPDIIINMYRISKSADKCLPEIDLDAGAGQTYDSTEKLDGTSGKRKYHYLMTDRSTSYDRQELKDNSTSYSSKEIAHTPRPILRKINTHKILDSDSIKESTKCSLESSGSNRTEHNSMSSSDDKTKSVVMVEPSISKTPVEKNSLTARESSHILSVLNMVVKQQMQSVHTQQILDENDKKIGRRCLNWLRCVPCVKNKKNESHFDRINPSTRPRNSSVDAIDMLTPIQANELQI